MSKSQRYSPDTIFQVAAVIVSVWAAFYASSWGLSIHRDNQESAKRNLDMVERQLALLEDQVALERDAGTIPRVTIIADDQGQPILVNMGEVAAKRISLNFTAQPDPNGSFSFYANGVLGPQMQVALNNISEGGEASSLDGTVTISGLGPTNRLFEVHQNFERRTDANGVTTWHFPELLLLDIESAAQSWNGSRPNAGYELQP